MSRYLCRLGPHVPREGASDRGLALALSIADDKLAVMELWFGDRADADGDSEGYRPNNEMLFLTDVQWLRWTLKRIADLKPIPTAPEYLAGRVPE